MEETNGPLTALIRRHPTISFVIISLVLLLIPIFALLLSQYLKYAELGDASAQVGVVLGFAGTIAGALVAILLANQALVQQEAIGKLEARQHYSEMRESAQHLFIEADRRLSKVERAASTLFNTLGVAALGSDTSNVHQSVGYENNTQKIHNAKTALHRALGKLSDCLEEASHNDVCVAAWKQNVNGKFAAEFFQFFSQIVPEENKSTVAEDITVDVDNNDPRSVRQRAAMPRSATLLDVLSGKDGIKTLNGRKKHQILSLEINDVISNLRVLMNCLESEESLQSIERAVWSLYANKIHSTCDFDINAGFGFHRRPPRGGPLLPATYFREAAVKDHTILQEAESALVFSQTETSAVNYASIIAPWLLFGTGYVPQKFEKKTREVCSVYAEAWHAVENEEGSADPQKNCVFFQPLMLNYGHFILLVIMIGLNGADRDLKIDQSPSIGLSSVAANLMGRHRLPLHNFHVSDALRHPYRLLSVVPAKHRGEVGRRFRSRGSKSSLIATLGKRRFANK